MSKVAVDLDLDLREAFSKVAELAALQSVPSPGVAGARLAAELGRRYWNEGGPQMAEVSEFVVPCAGREVPIVLYRPRSCVASLPVFVYLHGGGFKIGTQWANDRQMREIADAWGGIVISADYLHVPEHVFPAAVNETAAVLQWLHEHGSQWGIDGEQVGFGGNSAGAVVSFGAALTLAPAPWLRAAVGIVGAFSSDISTESMELYGDAGVFPNRAAVAAIFEDYVPVEADRNDPRAALLESDPTLLPSTFLAAAEFDVFRDASSALASRLQVAGRLDTFKIYPGMAHLFFGFSRSVAQAARCTQDIGVFLGRVLPVDFLPADARR